MSKVKIIVALFLFFSLATTYLLPSTVSASHSVGQTGTYCEGGFQIRNNPDGINHDPVVDASGNKVPCTPQDVIGQVRTPAPVARIGFGAEGLSKFLTNVIWIIYIVSSIAFLFMIIFSAFQWITSGGDKDAVASARKRITWAIIGVFVLSIAFVIARVVGNITGFTFFNAAQSVCEDKYYLDPNASNQCIHKFSPVGNTSCTYVFTQVDRGYCPP